MAPKAGLPDCAPERQQLINLRHLIIERLTSYNTSLRLIYDSSSGGMPDLYAAVGGKCGAAGVRHHSTAWPSCPLTAAPSSFQGQNVTHLPPTIWRASAYMWIAAQKHL